MDPVLSARGVVFHFGGQRVLDGVDFDAAPGSIVALAGANGAGKSTLFRVLLGLLQPQVGEVKVNGWRLPHSIRQARLSTGYVAQQFGLYPDLLVEENLLFYAQAYGVDSTHIAQRVEESLARFALTALRRHRAATLSHGWRQRLALAAALLHRPAALLLDEATAGLDAESRAQVWTILREEAARGAAILISTHYSEEVARCHQVVWLKAGRVALEAA